MQFNKVPFIMPRILVTGNGIGQVYRMPCADPHLVQRKLNMPLLRMVRIKADDHQGLVCLGIVPLVEGYKIVIFDMTEPDVVRLLQ